MAKHRKPLPTAEEKAERRKEIQNDKTKKAALVFIAILVVVVLFFAYSRFFGSPLAKSAAERNIKEHIAENYSTLDLELSKVEYDRDTQTFHATASSPTSEDTHFTIHFINGDCVDYYEDSVKGLHNTIDRFGDTFAKSAKDTLIQKGIADSQSEISLSTADFSAARESGEFKVDMKVTTELETEFVVYASLEKSATIKSLAETLTAMHNALSQIDLPKLARYTLILKDGKNTAKAYNVPTADIESGNLENILQNAHDNPFATFDQEDNVNPLTVYIQ